MKQVNSRKTTSNNRNFKGNSIRQLDKKKRKRRRIRRVTFRVSLLVLIIAGSLKGLSYATGYILNAMESKKQPETIVNQEKPAKKEVTPEDKLKTITENQDKYPEQLIELAQKKSETIDFVYNYPNRENLDKNVSSEWIFGNDEKFPLFIQWDQRWGYDTYGDNFIAINGCGPTTLAMVVAGLTGQTDVTPKTVAEYSFANSYYVDKIGSSWQLMNEGGAAFGVQSKEVPRDANRIIDILKSGTPIVASVGPGTFTSSGHFLLLTGVSEDGKIIINDPDSKIKSKQTWDIDVFIKEADNFWQFKKS